MKNIVRWASARESIWRGLALPLGGTTAVLIILGIYHESTD